MSVSPHHQDMVYGWLRSHTPADAERRACAELDDPILRANNDLGLSKGQRIFGPLREKYPELLATPEHYGRGVLMFMQGDAGSDVVLPFLSTPPVEGGVESHQKTAGRLRGVDSRLDRTSYWSFHLWGTMANSYMLFANTTFYGGNAFDALRKAKVAQRLYDLLPGLDHLVLDHSNGKMPELHNRQAA